MVKPRRLISLEFLAKGILLKSSHGKRVARKRSLNFSCSHSSILEIAAAIVVRLLQRGIQYSWAWRSPTSRAWCSARVPHDVRENLQGHVRRWSHRLDSLTSKGFAISARTRRHDERVVRARRASWQDARPPCAHGAPPWQRAIYSRSTRACRRSGRCASFYKYFKLKFHLPCVARTAAPRRYRPRVEGRGCNKRRVERRG